MLCYVWNVIVHRSICAYIHVLVRSRLSAVGVQYINEHHDAMAISHALPYSRQQCAALRRYPRNVSPSDWTLKLLIGASDQSTNLPDPTTRPRVIIKRTCDKPVSHDNPSNDITPFLCHISVSYITVYRKQNIFCISSSGVSAVYRRGVCSESRVCRTLLARSLPPFHVGVTFARRHTVFICCSRGPPGQ